MYYDNKYFKICVGCILMANFAQNYPRSIVKYISNVSLYDDIHCTDSSVKGKIKKILSRLYFSYLYILPNFILCNYGLKLIEDSVRNR